MSNVVGRSLISYILVDGDGPSLMGRDWIQHFNPRVNVSSFVGDTSGVDEGHGVETELN